MTPPGNTGTGGTHEQMAVVALERAGYACQTGVVIGRRPGGGKHKIDVVATRSGKSFLVSLKWQQVAGTAEQKVCFEIICLIEAMLEEPGRYNKAYLVLGGPGWTLRDFFCGGGLKKYIVHGDMIDILEFDNFISRVNRGSL